MTGWWRAWVDRCGREVDARPLHLVRIGVAVALLGDLAGMGLRGVGEAVLLPPEAGGLASAPDAWRGPLFAGALAVSSAAVAAGWWTRVALLVAVVASAGLGEIWGPGDRAIDRLLRTVMLILACSAASGSPAPARVARWPIDLLRWLLVIVYLQAGIVKVDARPGFLDAEAPALFTIACDPLAGRLDAETWAPWRPLFRLGGGVTLALELSAPLILTRWRRAWALVGAAMHVGLVLVVELGMFPFGMLALYPVLWWEEPRDGGPAGGAAGRG